jgi:hypothetical protein
MKFKDEKEKLDHIINILSALRDGKEIQYTYLNPTTKQNLQRLNQISANVLFDTPERYCIKTEPREWWAMASKQGIITSSLYKTREGLEKILIKYKDSPGFDNTEIIRVREVIE